MHNVSKSLSSLLLHYRSLILQLGDIEIDIEENSHSYLTQWSDATTEVWELSLVFWYFPRMQWRNVLRVPCLHLWKKENLLSRDKARNKWKYELVTFGPSLKIILPKHNVSESLSSLLLHFGIPLECSKEMFCKFFLEAHIS